MKRWISGAVAGLLVVLVGPVGVASAVDPGPAEPLATEEQFVPGGAGAGNQTDPHLSGSLLTYTALEGTESRIRYVDLADGSGGVVPNGGHVDSLPDVHGDHIVFRRVLTDGSSIDRPIMLFDVSAPEFGVRELAPQAGARRAFPAIGGTTVAFMQFVGGSSTQSEVCVADTAAPAAPAVCLTDDGLSNRDPAISPDGSTITWVKCQQDGTGCDVYVARRGTGEWGSARQLTDSTGEDILPATDGSIVTYTSNAGGDFDIWWKDVDGANERQLVLTDVPGSNEFRPKISQGAVSFERQMPGATNADLYLYRLTEGELFRVTDTPADEILNALSLSPTGELLVAWAQLDGLSFPHNDIHVVRAQLRVNQPPLLQLPADVEMNATGPAGTAVTFEVGATDDSGTAPVVACEPASGTTFAIGTTTVTCTATDDDGEVTTGSFMVTVTDVPNTPPTLQLPAAIAVDAVGPSGAPVTYAATATDADGTATVACAPVSGSTFAIGMTTVSCTAVDDDGATASGSFPVAVRGAREQLARFLVALTGVSPTSSHAATITTVVNRLPDRSLTLACEPLRLISKVLQAQSGRLVPADRAAALIADATRIRAVLACR